MILTLPSDQIVHILNLHPPDMSERMFVLYVDPALSSSSNGAAQAISAVAGALIAMGGLLLVALLACRCAGGVVANKASSFESGEKLFLYTLRAALDESVESTDAKCNAMSGVASGSVKGSSSDLSSLGDSLGSLSVSSAEENLGKKTAATVAVAAAPVAMKDATSDEGSDLSSVESSDEEEVESQRQHYQSFTVPVKEVNSGGSSSKSDESSSEGSDALDKV